MHSLFAFANGDDLLKQAIGTFVIDEEAKKTISPYILLTPMVMK